MKNIQPLHLILGGCGLGIISVFLPWISVSLKGDAAALAGAMAGQSASGINEGLGILALILMAGVIGSCFAKVPGKEKLIATSAMGAGGLAALVVLIELIRIFSNSGGNAFVSVSVGIGLYLCVLGAAAGAYGAFLRWQKTPADPAPPAGPPSPPSPPPQA
jgi:hypothetical protein